MVRFFLEKASEFIDGQKARLLDQLNGQRSFTLRITNGTDTQIKLSDAPHSVRGHCRTTFQELSPGEVGTLCFSGEGGHGGAAEFLIGKHERLSMSESKSTYGTSSFNAEFTSGGRISYRTTAKGVLQLCAWCCGKVERRPGHQSARSNPVQYIKGLPQQSTIQRVKQGRSFSLRVQDVVDGDDSEVSMIVASSKKNPKLVTSEDVVELSSPQQLTVAELCLQEKNSLEGNVMLIAEFAAVRKGMREAPYRDQAFALDLLIVGLVHDKFLQIDFAALQPNIREWQRQREKLNLGQVPLYEVFSQNKHGDDFMREYVSVCQNVLTAATYQCALSLEPFVLRQRQAGDWPPPVTLPDLKKQKSRKFLDYSRNKLKGIRGTIGDYFSTPEPDTPEPETQSRSLLGFTRETFQGIRGSIGQYFDTHKNDDILARHLGNLHQSSKEASLGDEPRNDFMLKELIRHCIHESAMFELRRQELLNKIAARSSQQQDAVNRYTQWLPLSKRSFCSPKSMSGLDRDAKFESICPQLFSNLSKTTCADQLLKSLGQKSGDYKSIATNSKSGEFFFFSHDKALLIKTVSEAEGVILHKMLPAYQYHIRRCDFPGSLIVRYAGLFYVEVPGAGKKCFTIMASVFDPRKKIHENFDVKGSLHGRHKKEDESTGKDVDWIQNQKRILLPVLERRLLLDAHERDMCFLMEHQVMDYSVLVGMHRLGEENTDNCTPTYEGSVLSEDGKTLYFLGIIDFLVGFSSYKQGEYLLRVLQGVASEASCVDPVRYAQRQVKFMRKHVLNPVAPEEDFGTVGRLTVHVQRAQQLVNADGPFGLSDPYVRVKLGLQHAKSSVVNNSLNPEWNQFLYLPVNEWHLGKEVELSVWDKDFSRAIQGADDFLGFVAVPMDQITTDRCMKLEGERLKDVDSGCIYVELFFEPTDNVSAPDDVPSAQEATCSVSTLFIRSANKRLMGLKNRFLTAR